MRRILFHLALVVVTFTGPSSFAQEPAPAELMAEAAWDWRPGDLIFRNGINDIDGVTKRAFGLRWESVGILRASSGGPRVVYVDQAEGVTEEMLYAYVEGLSADDYAVYRVRGLDHDMDAQMRAGPLVRLALTISYGAPFDDWFLLGDGRFYNAELAYESALNAGVVLGAPVRFRDLAAGPEDLDHEFRAVLEGHRYCRYELSFNDCWINNLADQSIVTTDSLISSGALDRVFP
ncbi:peptidoglycan peptidase [Pontibaca methylaminivorans]|uniref:peptidoglycan peptidase n=1 Tax=Pontibaca methylaminivorans TaxID=515897 RepID=UPI002FDAE8FE